MTGKYQVCLEELEQRQLELKEIVGEPTVTEDLDGGNDNDDEGNEAEAAAVQVDRKGKGKGKQTSG